MASELEEAARGVRDAWDSVDVQREVPGPGPAYAIMQNALRRLDDALSRESVKLPGLVCPNCNRIAYDLGGGRACYNPETHEQCGVMQPIWLLAYPIGAREEEN